MRSILAIAVVSALITSPASAQPVGATAPVGTAPPAGALAPNSTAAHIGATTLHSATTHSTVATTPPPPEHSGACDALANTDQANGLSFGRDAQVATAVGAVGGYFIGRIIGNNIGSGNAGRGGAIGAVVGASAGFIVGQVAARRRRAFQSESAYLDCEIETERNLLAQRTSEVEQAQRQSTLTQRDLTILNARIARKRATAEEVDTMRTRLANQLTAYNEQTTQLQREVAYYQRLGAQTSHGRDEDPAALAERRQQLSQRVALLQTQYETLNGITTQTADAAANLPPQA